MSAVDTLRLDLVYALRGWRSQRGATAIAIAALALGIGATTTVFAFVSGALLKPLAYKDPERLVMVWQDRSASGGPAREVISPGLFGDWSTRATALVGVSAIRIWSPNLTGKDTSGHDEPERLTGATVTGDYFATLGIPPRHGRGFNKDDDRFGAANTVVLSHRLWTRRFAGDPGLLGRTITLDSCSFSTAWASSSMPPEPESSGTRSPPGTWTAWFRLSHVRSVQPVVKVGRHSSAKPALGARALHPAWTSSLRSSNIPDIRALRLIASRAHRSSPKGRLRAGPRPGLRALGAAAHSASKADLFRRVPRCQTLKYSRYSCGSAP